MSVTPSNGPNEGNGQRIGSMTWPCHHGACGEGVVDECYHRPDFEWVGQSDPSGCGVACLAMVLEMSYDAARSRLRADPMTATSGGFKEGHSTNGFVIEGFLARQGWFHRTVYELWTPDDWPPRPFADRHIAQVEQSSGTFHFVAMDRSGIVLDPLRPGHYRLSDWPKVNNVTGWQRPTAPEPPEASVRQSEPASPSGQSPRGSGL